MRTILFITLLSFLLMACTSAAVKKVADNSPWEAFGYTGMAEEINLLAGYSLNCGIRNQLNANDPVNNKMTPSDSKRCVERAIKNKIPFRYGSVRVPTDSYLFDALVLSKDGEYWSIKYDVMLDGTDAQRFIERCVGANIDYDTLYYSGVSCRAVGDAEWEAVLSHLSESVD